jgi:hypothetical protein
MTHEKKEGRDGDDEGVEMLRKEDRGVDEAKCILPD